MTLLLMSMMNRSVDIGVCKHWAIAGAMRGFVPANDLEVIKLNPNASCWVPSLKYITCCSYYYLGHYNPPVAPYNAKLRDVTYTVTDFYTEHVYEPVCCQTSDTCCQPPESGELNAEHVNNTYIPGDPSDNPYAHLFDQDHLSVTGLTTRDVMIISATGGIVLIAVFVGIVIICTVHNSWKRSAIRM
jgi:hypothetical protein